MDDYNNINQIVQKSIEQSSYLSVIISSCVFIVYTFINKFIDYCKAKESHKPIIEMGNAIKEIGNNVAKLNNVLDKMIKDNDKKDNIKCLNTIELSFSKFNNNVFHSVRSIILNNHIEDNKELILSNINNLVSSEYYNIISIFNIYDIDGINISSFMKDKWINEVTTSVIGIIYNGQETESRINNVNTTLSILTDSYTTYIKNKITKNG